MQKAIDLQRFVDAQEGVYPTALAEIRQGRKRSHWMWFIFPQISGLGHSDMAKYYAISGRQEAEQYLSHPLLGPRLVGISAALLQHEDKTALDIFGTPDNLKLRSSMTLFSNISGANPVFRQVLEAFYQGQEDEVTVRLLGR